MSTWRQLCLQSANSLAALEIDHFLDRINALLSSILYLVGWIILLVSLNNCVSLFPQDSHLMERLWIIFPSLLLIKIAIPSLSILYMSDDLVDCSLRIKVNAHQWFWAYEYTDFYPIGVDSSIEFDRYVVAEGDLLFPGFRLLETENRPVLPYCRISQILTSRVDVLYSWTVLRLGVKADANPGRVNHVKLKPHNPGVFFGQCSEICGANHRFMPICLEFVVSEVFMDWVITHSERTGYCEEKIEKLIGKFYD